jgi:uncharacterized membrane protein
MQELRSKSRGKRGVRMVLDSALITIALMGLAFGPLWAFAWTKALSDKDLTLGRRVAGVMALSLATLFVVCIVPLIALAQNHGLHEPGAGDLNTVATLAFFAIPGVVIQVVSALGFAVNDHGQPR